jgi:serine/threonine-protein kinase
MSAAPDAPLTPDRWREIQRVFHAVAERPASERGAVLDAECAGDPALRAEVEALLAADAPGTGLLGGDGGVHALGTLADSLLGGVAAPVATTGRRVGPYTVGALIGRGGMGAVYLAERADVGLAVALKVVAGGLAAPERVARFLTERRVLARLEHPNIARLLDAGVADDGTPWFAMEYVRGEPIDRFCDAGRLGVAERLTLMECVCEAVDHAHRNLVVHRDLKPANVLVAEDGAPKLLDFGIAKLLGDADAAGQGGHTATGMRLLTPEYAAPEQFTGAPVTVATDVYALGMMLYELLTGRRPYRFEGRSAAEVERALLSGDPLRPSVAVTRPEERRCADGRVETIAPSQIAAARATVPAQLGRRLAGDLDAIVMRALAREPERRYASVEALLDDLRRHRRGLPVRAQPDTGRYRAGKFVRRHRPAVATAALLVALLAGFAGAMALAQARTARERDRARLAAARATQVRDILIGLFDAAHPNRAVGAAPRSPEALLLRGERAATALAGQPDVQADLLVAIGRAWSGLGDPAAGARVLRRAVAIRRQQLAPDDPLVADALDHLAAALGAADRMRAADSAVAEALAIRQRQVAAAALRAGDARTPALLGAVVGRALPDSGTGAARTTPSSASAVAPRPASSGATAPPEDSAAVLALARTVLRRATIAYEEGHCVTAVPLYREAAAMFARWERPAATPPATLAAADAGADTNRRSQPSTGAPARGAFASTPAGDRSAAPAADGGSDAGERLGLAEVTGRLALCLDRLGQHEQAGRAHRETLARLRQDTLRNRLHYAQGLNNYAIHLSRIGRLDQAEATQREALAIKGAILPAMHPSTAASLVSLAAVLARRGRLAAADSAYTVAVVMTRATLGAEHRRVAVALLGQGVTRLERRDATGAVEPLGEAVRVARAANPPRPLLVRRTTAALGTALLALGRAGEAEPLLREAVALDDSLEADPDAQAVPGATNADYELRELTGAALRARWAASLARLGRAAEARAAAVAPRRPARPR